LEDEPKATAVARACNGVQGQSPWSGGQSPPEADDIFALESQFKQ